MILLERSRARQLADLSLIESLYQQSPNPALTAAYDQWQAAQEQRNQATHSLQQIQQTLRQTPLEKRQPLLEQFSQSQQTLRQTEQAVDTAWAQLLRFDPQASARIQPPDLTPDQSAARVPNSTTARRSVHSGESNTYIFVLRRPPAAENALGSGPSPAFSPGFDLMALGQGWQSMSLDAPDVAPPVSAPPATRPASFSTAVFTCPGQTLETLGLWLKRQWSDLLLKPIDHSQTSSRKTSLDSDSFGLNPFDPLDYQAPALDPAPQRDDSNPEAPAPDPPNPSGSSRLVVFQNRMTYTLAQLVQRLGLHDLIETHLQGITDLVIIPHLLLHQIPFAALPVFDPQQYQTAFTAPQPQPYNATRPPAS